MPPLHLILLAAAGVAWWLLRPRRVPPGSAGAIVLGPGHTPPGGRFGHRRATGKIHNGIDVFAVEGTPVLAAAPGVVSFSGRISGYGEIVVVTHPDGRRSLYSHLSRRDVSVGTRVDGRTMVGTVGRTADGDCGRYFCKDPAHLHFEVITDDGPINRSRRRTDPVAWLASMGKAPWPDAGEAVA